MRQIVNFNKSALSQLFEAAGLHRPREVCKHGNRVYDVKRIIIVTCTGVQTVHGYTYEWKIILAPTDQGWIVICTEDLYVSQILPEAEYPAAAAPEIEYTVELINIESVFLMKIGNPSGAPFRMNPAFFRRSFQLRMYFRKSRAFRAYAPS